MARRTPWPCLGLLVLTLHGGSALAQSAPPTDRGADPERRALAHELIEASGGLEAARARLQAINGSIVQAMTEAMPKDQAALVGRMQVRIQDSMAGLLPRVMQITEEAYAEELTAQEMRDMVAFTTSPSGRSVQAKMPLVTQKAMIQLMPYVLAEMPAMMRRVADEVCAQSSCTPAQKVAIAAGIDHVFHRPGS